MLEAAQHTKKMLHRTIGKPYYSNYGYTLYNGDCLEYMRKLSKSPLDVTLTVTSPPYNIGKPYEKKMDTDAYVQWCVLWLEAIYANMVPTGVLWLNLGYVSVQRKGLCVPIPYLLWDKTPFYLLQEIVWYYGAGVTSKHRFCPRNEKWLFYVCDPKTHTFNLDDVRDPNVKYPNQKKNGKLRCNPLGKNPSDVWEFPKVTTGKKRSSKERTGHPAQFPLKVIDRIVKVSSHPLELVMDPFSGSGTSGIASVGNGRLYLGFEVSEEYCCLSVERFEQFMAEKGT